MRPFVRRLVVCLLLGLLTIPLRAGDVSWPRILRLVRRAREAYRKGRTKEAFERYDRAAALPSDTSPLQRKALDRINYHRKHAMLVPVMPDERIARAAAAHARYLGLNAAGDHALSLADAHREQRGKPGFTAARVVARLAHFGFNGNACEVVSAVTSPVEAVDHLMNTVYHRGGILKPQARYAGFGAQSRAVVDFGWSPEDGEEMDWCLYPGFGQEDVPPRFPGGETPNPLPGATYPVGPPITIGAAERPPRLLEATLTGPDGTIPLKELRRGTAPRSSLLGLFIHLMPLRPLRPNTAYRVFVRFEAGKESWRYEWSFETGDETPGEEYWSAKVTRLTYEPRLVKPGVPVSFVAEVKATHPDEVRLRWSVDGKEKQTGTSLSFQWTPLAARAYEVEARAVYPEKEGVYGRRVLKLFVLGADRRLPSGKQALGLSSSGKRRVAIHLDLDPKPPWKAGTSVRMCTRAEGFGSQPLTYSFVVDGTTIVDKGSKPEARWKADGKVKHTFKVKVHYGAATITRTLQMMEVESGR